MKKVVSTLLAATMALPCVFGLTACNDDSLKAWHILKDEWELVVSHETGFNIHCYDDSALDNGDLKSLSITVEQDGGDELLTYGISYKGEAQNKTFVKKPVHQPSGVTYEYYEQIWSKDTGTFTESQITEETFNAPLVSYYALVDYVDNNYDKFSLSNHVYTCDVSSMNAENASIASLGIEHLQMARFAEGVKTMFYVNGAEYTIEYDNPLYIAFENTAKFAIKGGPSTEDIDYAEYYFDGDNGFRLYSPNNPVANRTDGYYKSNGDGTYTQYVKQDDGSWITGNAPAYNVNSAKQAVIEQYLGFMQQMGQLMVVEAREGDRAAYVYGLANGDQITTMKGGITYSYYDICLLAYFTDNSPRIYSITWKMKMSNAMAESLEYNMKFTTAGVDIVYPTVG